MISTADTETPTPAEGLRSNAVEIGYLIILVFLVACAVLLPSPGTS